ncbi:uncharacterized protein KIAA1614-like isoform X3 [Chiloscyllium punctatum]|uniref:uncharacterized protein KIAA1614-like isoform X3 n=1 Tax=Chiloscyllium punctatum TaxID=137246 RepID=UPI003B637F59
MAESEVVPGGQRPRLRERRDTTGVSAARKGRRGTGSASLWEDSANWASPKNRPHPGAPALPTNQQLWTGVRSSGRAAPIPQVEGRDCPDLGEGRERGRSQKDREPRRTYLTDSVLGCQEPLVVGEGEALSQGTDPGLARREWPGTGSWGDPPRPTGDIPPPKPAAKNWRPPRGFWKVLGRENAPPGDRPGAPHDVIAREETESTISSEHASSHPGGGPRAVSEGEKWSACRLGQLEALWRTDSWESVGSNASLVSLSERVEMNRSFLKRMLRPASWQPGPGLEDQLQENPAAHVCHRQPRLPGDHTLPENKRVKQGCGAVQSDSDWDSGISLQESDPGLRAFVSPSQLPLSRRHEQAKQLLERARMKARTSPLKADHSILPIERSPRDARTDGSSSPKRGPPSRERFCPNSDSSSGDSHCRPRKKRGQSPSRVRFEDESTQEAEVRHQLRRRGGVEPSGHLATGGLVPDPRFPAYQLARKERSPKAGSGEASKPHAANPQPRALWRGPATPRANGEVPGGGATAPRANTAFCIDGKCSSCGCYIISEPAVCEPPSYEFPDVRVGAQDEEAYHRLDAPRDPARSLRAGARDAVCSLSPIPIPCSVLTSGPRITIEPIKETYIGDVTSIDDIPVTGIPAGSPGHAERKDCKDRKVLPCYYAVVSGSDGGRAGDVGVPAREVDLPRKGLRENGATSDLGSAPSDGRSKPSGETGERGGVSGQRCRSIDRADKPGRCAVSKQVARVCGPGDSPKAGPSSEQLPGKPSLCKQRPLPLPLVRSGCSSDQTQAVSSLPCPPLSLQDGTGGPGNGQFAKDRDGPQEPGTTDPALPPNLPGQTCGRQPLLKRPSKGKSGLCQQGRVALVRTDSPVTHRGTCPSLRSRLLPRDGAGTLPESPALPEASSLQPGRQVPWDHTLAVGSSGPAAHLVPGSDPTPLRETLNAGPGQSSIGWTPDLGRPSTVTHQPIDPNGGLPASEHQGGDLEASRIGNSWSVPGSERMSTSEDAAEKRLNKPAGRELTTVKIWPHASTDRSEVPTPVGTSDLGECQRLAQPPETGPIAAEPNTRPGVSRESPNHHSNSRPSEDNQEPGDPSNSPRGQCITESQQRPRSALRAFFSSLGHNTVRKLSRIRSASMEQLSPRSADPRPTAPRSEEVKARLRKSPSLQSLQLVSPLAYLRKAVSFQSLHPQVRRNHSSSYLVEEVPPGLGNSEAQTRCSPGTALHGGDLAPPRHPRLVGQVTQTFANASFMLELSKPAGALFGFHISRLSGRIFIHQMADRNAEKLYAGLLEVGDEILEVNGESVEGLSFSEVNSLMLRHSTVSIWVRRRSGTRQPQEQ